jgi:hypothetical protein
MSFILHRSYVQYLVVLHGAAKWIMQVEKQK